MPKSRLNMYKLISVTACMPLAVTGIVTAAIPSQTVIATVAVLWLAAGASLAIAAAVPKQERAQIPRRAVVVVLAAVIPHEIAG